MIEAVMYGMMPRAKIVSRRNWPPLNRSTKPRNVPRLESKNCCSRSALIPGVGMCPPRRYTASSPSVNRMRLRRSGTRNTFASFSSIERPYLLFLLLRCPLGNASVSVLVGDGSDLDLDDFGLPARGCDLFLCRL